jgi:tRNA pseudouridine38-40 synthase
MRIGLKIAYDGRDFHGFARQPDVRTVEGEVLFALKKAGIIETTEAAGFQGASRTDAGVSALGNVIAFDTEVEDDSLVGRFNDAAKGVWAWAVANLPPKFNARRARVRWYRYAMSGHHELAVLTEAANVFVGTHDFAAFASPDAERTRRHVDSVDLIRDGEEILVDVRAPSFLRGMVRRIVSALLAVERGDINAIVLADALAAGKGPDLGLAPPEPLVLMDVDIGIPFQSAAERATRARILQRANDERTRARFWREAALRVRARVSENSPEETEVGSPSGSARGNT